MGKKGEATKKQIQNVAYGLFAEKGFTQVTMKDIYINAKLSSGGLYRHYESTTQIFSDIVDEIMDNLKNEFTHKMEREEPAVQILDEFLAHYQSEMLDSDKSLGLAMYEYFSLISVEKDNSMLRQYQLSSDALCALIEYGIRRGEFNTVDAKPVVDLLLFSYQGVRMWSKIMLLDESVPAGIIGQIKNIIYK